MSEPLTPEREVVEEVALLLESWAIVDPADDLDVQINAMCRSVARRVRALSHDDLSGASGRSAVLCQIAEIVSDDILHRPSCRHAMTAIPELLRRMADAPEAVAS